MDPFLLHVAKSLGRDAIPTTISVPPTIDESFARLTRDEGNLSLVFTAAATAAKLHVHLSDTASVVAEIVAFCVETKLTSAVVTRCDRFDQLGLLDALRQAGIDARYWNETTLDATYDVNVDVRRRRRHHRRLGRRRGDGLARDPRQRSAWPGRFARAAVPHRDRRARADRA